MFSGWKKNCFWPRLLWGTARQLAAEPGLHLRFPTRKRCVPTELSVFVISFNRLMHLAIIDDRENTAYLPEAPCH